MCYEIKFISSISRIFLDIVMRFPAIFACVAVQTKSNNRITGKKPLKILFRVLRHLNLEKTNQTAAQTHLMGVAFW